MSTTKNLTNKLKKKYEQNGCDKKTAQRYARLSAKEIKKKLKGGK